jgi:acyl-CoA synthetase (NDP forming)
MKGDIHNFFYPKTIAVIGASNNPLKVGNVLMKKLCECKRKVIPINIKRSEIEGKKAYPSILKYPKKIDLAIIAIPAKLVNSSLIECGKKKIHNIIIISSGFSEIGKEKLEKKILQTAKKYKIRILGPNCFGVANPYLNLDTTFSNTSPLPGNTALISQSGALWSYISDFRKFKFSGFVSLGNMSDLTFSDFIEYFNKDPKTKKIILYIEKLKLGKKFVEICRKSKKQIIVVKAGKTKKGSEATISHTGSLATEFAVYKGAFKQSRVKVMDSLAQAFGIKKQNIKIPKTKKVKIITNAGGAGALLTDYLTERGIDVTVKDLLGTALAKDYEQEIKKSKGQLIIVLTPQKMSEPLKTAQALIKFKNKNPITCFLGEKSVARAVKLLKAKNIKVYTRCV